RAAPGGALLLAGQRRGAGSRARAARAVRARGDDRATAQGGADRARDGADELRPGVHGAGGRGPGGRGRTARARPGPGGADGGRDDGGQRSRPARDGRRHARPAPARDQPGRVDGPRPRRAGAGRPPWGVRGRRDRGGGVHAGMTFLLAISRADVARYVNVLVIVYVVIIFIRILMSWLPRIPYNRWLMAFLDFVTEVTDPYLN